MHEEDEVEATANRSYAERLARLSGARWKRILHVQAPYRAHIRALRLGRTLDVGCGTGRNLHYLDSGSVGVDHNEHAVQIARDAGLEAYTPSEFFTHAGSALATFDSMLSAHVIEHMSRADALALFKRYLPQLRPGGRVVWITPQERGYATDATHVEFVDFAALRSLAADLGLETLKSYSFPFPRFAGRVFPYNEFVQIARMP